MRAQVSSAGHWSVSVDDVPVPVGQKLVFDEPGAHTVLAVFHSSIGL
jgi:hypothetical protein